MATTGTRIVSNTTTLCNTTTICGQGVLPEFWVLYSTDDVSVSVPTWVDATADLRRVNTSRGKGDERSETDAGTATIVLGNRTRTYDPVNNAAIRPLNRWWVREQFTGETQDIFVGYATAYEQSWPGTGSSDAETTVACVDESKVLDLTHLPVTDPPRDTYQGVVAFDNPTGYWPITFVDATSRQLAASIGNQSFSGAIGGNQAFDPIAGQSEDIIGFVQLGNSAPAVTTGTLSVGDPGDVSGLSEVTIEFWFAFSALPGATVNIAAGPNGGSATTWRVRLDTSGHILFEARNSAGTLFTATSSVQIASGTDPSVSPPWNWKHVVCTITGGNLRIYLNGVQDTSTAFTPGFNATLDASQAMTLCDAGYSGYMYFDELAFYRYGLSASRIVAHYTAGASRGFVRFQLPRARANAILDSITSHAPRRFTTPGSDNHNMQGARMVGQGTLGEIRTARDADNVDAILYIGRDGAIVFLDYDHRSGSPYNTVQATFDDDGTDLPYEDLTLDYSDSFLFNAWNVTRTGGTLQSVSDATSISRYFKRSAPSITDLPVTSDSTASNIAFALLAKYKDPMTRITEIKLTTDVPAVTEAVFRRDIGDRIRVFRTPPGGGSRIDQTLFIQKIQVDAVNDPRAAWRITWGVSPV